MAEQRIGELIHLIAPRVSQDEFGISLETLVDALLVIYDECQKTRLAKELQGAEFLEGCKFFFSSFSFLFLVKIPHSYIW